jgi:TonB family protein
VWPRELPETIDLAHDRVALPDDDHPEPQLAALPFFVEYDEPVRLDPERIGLLWELPPRASNPIRARGPFSSLLIHLLPLLTVIAWPHPALELPRPIPVQLVLEQPPPPPPQPPEPGRRASDDFGVVKPPDPGTAADAAPATAGEKQASAPKMPTQEAHLVAPPPVPPPKPVPPLAEPAPFKLPKPAGAPVPRHADPPHEATRTARYPGPAATRDEYFAYLRTLTLQHIDLLPAALVGGRRGELILSVGIRDDGAITRIVVVRSSGWPDLDERVERMVRAVGRFPPPPQWFQGNVLEADLTVGFPLVER